jgi:MFS family permease
MIAMALLGMLTYSGSGLGAAVGYLLAVLAASVFAPAAGALTNELFPTSVRASVIGWEIAVGVFGATAGLLAFGAVADVGNRFGLAAIVVFAATIPATGLFALLPETRDKEPEDLWPTGS